MFRGLPAAAGKKQNKGQRTGAAPAEGTRQTGLCALAEPSWAQACMTTPARAQPAPPAAGPCLSPHLGAWRCPLAPKALLQGEQAELCCRRLSGMIPVQHSEEDYFSPKLSLQVHHTLKCECNPGPARLMLVVFQESLCPCSSLGLILQGTHHSPPGPPGIPVTTPGTSTQSCTSSANAAPPEMLTPGRQSQNKKKSSLSAERRVQEEEK